MNVACIGAGYVGGPTMAVIADRCPEIRVTVVDVNADRIAQWNSSDLPIYEPGLSDVVQRARGRNLFFSTEIASAIAEADIIFVSVNTPTKSYGAGAGMASDLQYWELTARQILQASNTAKIVVEKSTLPVRTATAMETILNTNDKGLHFEVLSNPEFMAEGTAIADLENPDRVLLGGQQTPSGAAALQMLAEIYAHWVPREKIILSNVWSAELSKLAANAFLAQRVSSINAISALCEVSEADVDEVAVAIGKDNRIGSKFLKASVGFGGSCFQKDVLNLVYLCKHYGLPGVADYWHNVVKINTWQEKRLVKNMLKYMFNTLSSKRIAVLGFSFKANTSDTRNSPADCVVRELVSENAQVIVTDPKALANARLELADLGGKVSFVDDEYEACLGAHAIVVCTEWEKYTRLDFARIYSRMEKPAFVFDGRNLLDAQALFAMGFHVVPIGKKPLLHWESAV